MVIQQLQQFIEDFQNKTGSNRKWISDDQMQVYIRHGFHRLPDIGLTECLDIATIEVYNPGQGIFTEFLNKAVELNPWRAIYIENVLNPDLEASLIRKGWQMTGEYPTSFFMLNERKEE